MTENSASDRLRTELASLTAAGYALDADALWPLREKVCAVVDELKAAGLAPEHVLLAVKGMAYDAKLGLSSQRLVDTIVTWCIERYFATERRSA